MNTSKTLLTVASRDLRTLVLKLNDEAEEALAWNDPSRVLPVITPLSNWLHANYSAKTGYQLEAVLRSLSKDRETKEAATEALSQVKFNIYRENKQSCLDQVTILSECMEQITGVLLSPEVESLRAKIKKLRKIKRKDAGIEVEREKPTLPGCQRAQANAIADEILGGLDKKVAGILRQQIARADNRLKALRSAMEAMGIA